MILLLTVSAMNSLEYMTNYQYCPVISTLQISKISKLQKIALLSNHERGQCLYRERTLTQSVLNTHAWADNCLNDIVTVTKSLYTSIKKKLMSIICWKPITLHKDHCGVVSDNSQEIHVKRKTLVHCRSILRTKEVPKKK